MDAFGAVGWYGFEITVGKDTYKMPGGSLAYRIEGNGRNLTKHIGAIAQVKICYPRVDFFLKANQTTTTRYAGSQFNSCTNAVFERVMGKVPVSSAITQSCSDARFAQGTPKGTHCHYVHG